MKNLLKLLFITSTLFAQNIELENNFVKGLIYSQEATFLILNDGFLKISDSDPYQDYYRKIYNDSTIVNPNTILTNEFDLNIIPFLNPVGRSKKHIFEDFYSLGTFVNLKGYNNAYLTPEALSIIDSILTNEED